MSGQRPVTTNPMLSQQSMPAQYPSNPYYRNPSQMSYQQASPLNPVHRSLSQPGGAPSNYSLASTPVSSNGTGSKPNLIDPIDVKSEEIFDDPSKLIGQPQQHQQHQAFHPGMPPRPRLPSAANPMASGPLYSNMQPNANPYYSNQRPLTPSTDFNMPVVRGPSIRPSMMPNNNNSFGNLAGQQRVRTPLTTALSAPAPDLNTGMNANVMGLQSTPSPLPNNPPR